MTDPQLPPDQIERLIAAMEGALDAAGVTGDMRATILREFRERLGVEPVGE